MRKEISYAETRRKVVYNLVMSGTRLDQNDTMSEV